MAVAGPLLASDVAARIATDHGVTVILFWGLELVMRRSFDTVKTYD